MDRLELAIELILEAQAEKKRLEAYDRDRDKLPSYRDPEYWTMRNWLVETYTPIPKKSIIIENIKVARRILLGESKKV